jgi:hypothetical protein
MKFAEIKDLWQTFTFELGYLVSIHLLGTCSLCSGLNFGLFEKHIVNLGGVIIQLFLLAKQLRQYD